MKERKNFLRKKVEKVNMKWLNITTKRLISCNIRLLQSHMRLKKNRPYNHWLKSQGHYLLCFSTSNQSEPIRFVCDMRLRPVTA